MPNGLDGMSAAIGLAAGLALAALVAWLMLRERMARVRAEHAALALRGDQADALAAERAGLAKEREALSVALGEARARIAELGARLDAATAQAQERLGLLQNARESLRETFQSLAGEILEDKSRRFTEQNATQLGSLLNPLREQLKEFKQSVVEGRQKESTERAVLKHEIDALKSLNLQIGADAKNLTLALKGDTRTQGAWGELVLERLLEASGLQKGREYETQQTLWTELGERQRPDVIVHLPEGRDLIIDAKVSLTAYERYCGAADDAERGRQLGHHLASLRSHVKELGARRYDDLAGVRSLEFVLMFVPIEAAFIDAVRHDDTLYVFALERQVAIVTTSTLLATLRTVSSLWRFDDRNRNAIEIAEKAGALYDKFAGFVADLEKVQAGVDGAQRALQEAVGKLASGKGNLVRRVEELKRLGAKASKALPQEIRERSVEAEAIGVLPEEGDGETLL